MGANRFVIGIDPGQSGAVAMVQLGALVGDVFDMPTYARKAGGQMVDASRLSSLLLFLSSQGPTTAVIERVSAMPGQGVSSMFRFGQSEGIVRGVLAAHGVPVLEAAPNAWKKHFGLTGKDKDAARGLAIQRFPLLSGKLAKKKDVGRADALLIALWAIETGRVS